MDLLLLLLLHYIIIVWMAENNDVEIHMYSMWNESSNRNPFRCFLFFFFMQEQHQLQQY